MNDCLACLYGTPNGPFVQQNNLDTPCQLVIEPGEDPVLYDPHTECAYTFDHHTGGEVTGKVLKIEDGKGNAHTLTYDVDGDLMQISDGLGRTIDVTFDGDWLIGSVTDQGGRTVTYEYGGTVEDSELLRISDAMNRTTGAIESASAYLDEHPDDLESMFVLAAAFAQKNDLDQAYDYVRR